MSSPSSSPSAVPAAVVDGLGQSGNNTSRRRRRLSLDGHDADSYDDSLSHIFAENAAWASSMKASDPDYFKTLARLPQKPDILWISCCDSRVPVELLINARPGQVPFADTRFSSTETLPTSSCPSTSTLCPSFSTLSSTLPSSRLLSAAMVAVVE